MKSRELLFSKLFLSIIRSRFSEATLIFWMDPVEGSDLNEDRKEDLSNLVSLNHGIFIKGIEGLPQTPLLEFRVELNDYSPLIQKLYVVVLVLEDIMKRLIQHCVDAGFYIWGTFQYFLLVLSW